MWWRCARMRQHARQTNDQGRKEEGLPFRNAPQNPCPAALKSAIFRPEFTSLAPVLRPAVKGFLCYRTIDKEVFHCALVQADLSQPGRTTPCAFAERHILLFSEVSRPGGTSNAHPGRFYTGPVGAAMGIGLRACGTAGASAAPSECDACHSGLGCDRNRDV